jgi:SAM-dependent methyltransferase
MDGSVKVLPAHLVRTFFDEKWGAPVKEDETGPLYKDASRIVRVFIEELCKKSSDKGLLDLGCGDGRYTLMLAEGGFKVRGVDFSQEAIKRLLRRAELMGLRGRVEGSVSDMARFEFGDERFLGVSAFDTLHYLSDSELGSLLDKIKGCIVENGLVCISFEAEISMRLRDGGEFRFGNQPYRSRDMVRGFFVNRLRDWRIVAEQERSVSVMAGIPPSVRGLLGTEYDSYRRSFKSYEIIAEKPT